MIFNFYYFASKNKFNIVYYKIESNITIELLSNELIKVKDSYIYQCDGLVIYRNQINPIVISGNPNFAFAFKSILTNELAEIIVTEITWQISKDAYLKPVIHFQDIYLDGSKINKTTGKNARYIQENKIGAGSKLVLIKSGGVIPNIHQVLTQTQPDFPKNIKYIWNETSTDIMLENKTDNKEIDIKLLINFMEKIEVKNVSNGIIKKLYN